jgi:lipopolysaccharide transport system permease protein
MSAVAGAVETHAPAFRPREENVVVIEPNRGWASFGLRELWKYRELLYFMTWRDVKVRYKQTVLGAAWAILQPLMTMVVFTIFFGRLGQLPSDNIPYPLFSFTALIPWVLFTYSLTQTSMSLVTNQQLISKVYFPRLVMPLAAVGAGLLDFAIAFVVLIIMMAGYGYAPGWQVVTLPLFLLFAIATAVGVGLWLSALNARYRDVQYTIPFLMQFWLLATPIAYSAVLVPIKWRVVYGLNPMAGVVQGFRWALLGRAPAFGPMLAVSVAVVLALLVSGLYYFRKTESVVADVV